MPLTPSPLDSARSDVRWGFPLVALMQIFPWDWLHAGRAYNVFPFAGPIPLRWVGEQMIGK